MNGIDFKEVLVGILAFVLLSFLFKLAILASFANLIVNFFPEESLSPVHIGVLASIAVTGLALGKLLNIRVATNPLSHALFIGGMAAIYKLFRPDLDPLPLVLVVLFSLLNFGAVLWGAHVTASK